MWPVEHIDSGDEQDVSFALTRRSTTATILLAAAMAGRSKGVDTGFNGPLWDQRSRDIFVQRLFRVIWGLGDPRVE